MTTSHEKRGSTYGAMRWLLAATVLQRVVSVASLAIIGRLLPKPEYGVFRELLSLHVICFVLLPLGIDQLYLREVNERPRFAAALRASLWISAFLLSLLVVGFRSWLTVRLKLHGYSWLLFAFPVALVFQAAKLEYRCILSGQLNFRRIGIAEFLNTTVTMAGGALLLIWWRSPVALYAAYAAGEILEYATLRVGARFESSRIQNAIRQLTSLRRSEWKFAAFASGDQLLNAISANAPVLILGGSLALESAAEFSMGMALITMPLFVMVGALTRVALPSLAGRSEDDLQQRTLELLAAAAAYIVPVLLGVAIFAGPIVQIVLGPDWVDQTTPIVRMLAVYCIFVGMFSPISSLDVIRDRMDVGFTWNLVTMVVRVGALAWGQHHGVPHAVAAYALASAVMWLVNGFVLSWLLCAGAWQFHRTWLQFVPVWLLLALISYGCLRVAGPHPLLAILMIPIPGAIYMAAVHLLYPTTGKLLVRLIASERARRVAGLLRLGESTDVPTGSSGANIP